MRPVRAAQRVLRARERARPTAVTIYDVAERARVSAATVSRVLNDRQTVDPKLARRVRAAVKDLGYRRNAVAGNLRLRKTSLLAVVISDIANPFFTALVRGVEDVAQETSYSVVLCNSDEDAAKEAEYLDDAVSLRMAGVILSPTRGGTGPEALVANGIPVVTIDREIPGMAADAVVVDNRGGAQAAVRHLIENGYERIACISGPGSVFTAVERRLGYEQALRAAGYALDRDLVRSVDFREAGGFAAMTELLGLRRPPDAVFVANNLMTLGALRAIMRLGLKVPRDVGVVGFDEVPWAELIQPRLTTVAQPAVEVGREAARMLLARIASPEAETRRRVLPTNLVVRDSSVPRRRGPNNPRRSPLRTPGSVALGR